jgi:lysophospholipase L1-like esterase
MLGRYVMAFDRYDSTGTRTILQANVLMSVTGNSVSTYLVGRGINSGDNLYLSSISMGDHLAGALKTMSLITSVNGKPRLYRDGQSDAIPASPVTFDSNPHVLITTLDTTTFALSVNEVSSSVSKTSDATAYAGGWLGCIWPSFASSCSHRIVGFGICNTVLTANQQTSLRYGSYARFNIKPQAIDQVFLLGDSRSSFAKKASNAPEIGRNIAVELAERLSGNAKVYNISQGGETTALALANKVPTIVSMYQANVKNTVVILLGINDFIVSTLTVAQVLAGIQAVIAPLKTAGFSIVLINELATTSTGGGASTNIPLLRSQINALGASGMNVDGILDVSALTPINTPSNTAYYSDGTHPTAPVDALIASAIVPYITTSSKVLLS